MKGATFVLLLGFLSIILNQGIWIHNMKKTYYEDYSLLFNNLLNISIQRDDQDSLSVNLEKVDISLKKHLEEANLMLPYKLELCKNERIINTVGNYVEKADDYIYLSPRIAISDSLFLCCSAIIPSSFIIGKMKRINDISCWAMIFSIACLIYLLLNIMKKEKKLKSNALVIYGTIHDLKSPLSLTYLLISRFAGKESDHVKKQSFLVCKAQLYTLSNAIETLLSVLKMTDQHVSIKKEPVDLRGLIDSIIENLSVLYFNKHFTLLIEDKMETDWIEADLFYLRNSLTNLLDNSLKYSDENVKIEILLEKRLDTFSIAIKDTGWGISGKLRKKLFAQCCRGDRHDQPKGHGLGLMYTARVVKNMGGDLTFQSVEGEGSTFIITLPC
ncbi:sensor histidine kinase [Parabacteroides sp. AF18-52]|jgi:two-component system sensor histidine kinase|nr:sensor histidine kinase [Parabacteroides sp. AF18-52]